MANMERFIASDQDLNRTMCNGDVANVTPFVPYGVGWGALADSDAGALLRNDDTGRVFEFDIAKGARVLRIGSLAEAGTLITRDRTMNQRVDFEALRADYDAILYVPADIQGEGDDMQDTDGDWGWQYGQLCVLNPDAVSQMPDAQGMEVTAQEGSAVSDDSQTMTVAQDAAEQDAAAQDDPGLEDEAAKKPGGVKSRRGIRADA